MQSVSRAAIRAVVSIVVVAGCASAPPAAESPAASVATVPPAAPVEIVVAATTDVHGRLRAWDYFAAAAEPTRGLARLATVVDSLRAANEGRVVLLDAGDLLQGNPLTYVAAKVSRFTPHPVIAAMNAMRYDAAAIGNHEFNYGVPFLDSTLAEAKFPFLAVNAERLDGGPPFIGTATIQRAGVTIAIIGATNPGSVVWDRDHLKGRVAVRDIVPAVRDAVAGARSAGAEVVVVTMHSGLDEPSSYDTVGTGVPSENVAARVAREVDGIDLIVFGHSHRELADSTIGTTLLMQARNHATSLGVATLTVAGARGARRVVAKRGRVIQARGHAEHTAVTEAVAAAHSATVAYAATTIGRTTVAWRADSARVVDAPVTDFVLEVMRRTAKADLAATAAFSVQAGFDTGAITIAEVARLYPYENTLRAVRISGAQLRSFLEYSSRYYRVPGSADRIIDPRVPGFNFDIVAGADYTLDISRPLGQRVTRLDFRGRPVADTDTFTLALNNYRQTGGGGFAMLAGAPVVYDDQEEIRQLLIDEVRRRGMLRPADFATVNWTLLPAGARPQIYSEQSGERGGGEGGRATGSSGTPRLRIIATTDLHGAIEPRPDSRGIVRGGLAYLAGVADSLARACPAPCEILLVDAGDMFQGTPASNMVFGKPVVDVMNRMGYAAAALGNHEFDWGQDTLRSRMRGARFGFFAANVRDSSGRDVRWIPNDTIVRRGGFVIGIVGAAKEDTPLITKLGNTNGLRFDPPAPIVDSIVRSLRARGATVVVVVAHLGAFCDRTGAAGCKGEIVDFANALTAPVDAIVSGHTHALIDAIINGIPVVQARSRGSAVAMVDVLAGTERLPDPGRVIDVLQTSPRSAAIDSIVQPALARVWPIVSRPTGAFAEAMPNTGTKVAIGSVVADAQRWATRSDVAVMNNGGIRAGVQAGNASYGSLYEVQPFGNMLVVVSITGEGLQRYLERIVRSSRPDINVSGLTVRFDTTRAAGSRIVGITMSDGRPLDPRRTYTMAMNDFMVTGGDDYGLRGEHIAVRQTGIVDLDALLGYMREQKGPVSAPREPRFIIVNSW